MSHAARVCKLVASLLVLISATILLAGPDSTSANHKTHAHTNTILNEDSYLPGEVVSNVIGQYTEYRVGSFTGALDTYAAQAVTDWNNALRNFTPNTLTKYSFHCCFNNDASSTTNVRVYGFAHATFVTHCANGNLSTTVRGCVEDDLTPGNCTATENDCTNITLRPLYVIIDTDHITQNLLDHEFGHILYFNEHYIKNADDTYSCGYASGVTIMDAIGCGALVPQSHDRGDFFNVYKPQDTPNLTTMNPNSSTQVSYAWNAGPAYRHNIESFYVDKTSDTNTSVLQFNNVSVLFSSQAYSIADGDRFCATARGFTNAGFTSGNPWTPYPYYGCANRGTGPSAGGPFVVTSQREYGNRIKIRNSSGATRYIKVVGPSSEDVGCSTLQTIGNGAVYQCVASVSIRQYATLVWIACTTTGCTAASYGNIDFD